MAVDAARLAAAPGFGQVANSAFLVGTAHRGDLQCLADALECDERRALEVADVRALLLLGAELTSGLLCAERRLIEDVSAREGAEDWEEKKKRSHGAVSHGPGLRVKHSMHGGRSSKEYVAVVVTVPFMNLVFNDRPLSSLPHYKMDVG